MKTIVDTGPLVALLNGHDRHHAWTRDALARLELPLWTCEPVLTEAAYLSGRPDAVTGMVAERALRLGLSIDEEAAALTRLLRRWAGRMDLADACVVRMAEMSQACQVFTLDRRDFSVYRRNGRHVIPLLAPPS